MELYGGAAHCRLHFKFEISVSCGISVEGPSRQTPLIGPWVPCMLLKESTTAVVEFYIVIGYYPAELGPG